VSHFLSHLIYRIIFWRQTSTVVSVNMV